MTDKEKLERYEKMNTGIRPKYHKGNHIKDWWTCGQCGATVSCGVISNFCMNCGYRIKWDHPRCLTGANKNVEVALHKEDDLEGQMDITDFPEVFESRAKLERLVGYSILKESDGTPLYLDELDPNRGDMNTEIFPDCGIMCYLAQGR